MQPQRSILGPATVFYVALAVVACLWSAIAGRAAELFAGASGRWLAYGLLTGVGIVVACHLLALALPSVRRAGDRIGDFLGPIGVGGAVYLALLSGFAEEILFRGTLWPYLGLVGSSILFGILHTVPLRELAWYPVFAAFAGLVFGGLRQSSGSVWPCVIAHTTVNALNLAYLGRRCAARLPAPAPPEDRAPPRAATDLALPTDLGVHDDFPVTIWHYKLTLEPEGTDRRSLPECLAHEQLELFQYVAREEVYRQLRAGRFSFAETFDHPLGGFPEDLAAFSAYLFQTVTGIEVAERFVDETTTDDVRGWKTVARRGEWVKVPLLVSEPEPGRFELDADREDTEILAAHWNEYPRWFQDGMRFKYPRLRDL